MSRKKNGTLTYLKGHKFIGNFDDEGNIKNGKYIFRNGTVLEGEFDKQGKLTKL